MTAAGSFPEWVSVFFFSFFSVVACLRPMQPRQRVNAIVFGIIGIGLVLLLFLPGLSEVNTFRRLLPLILIPMAYWQTGQFNAPLNQKLQAMLVRFDQHVLPMLERGIPRRIRRWLHVYGEYAYILCYPMVPSGIAVLYAAGAAGQIEEFWSVVLPPAYLCYATLPFLRTLPPRALEQRVEQQIPRRGIRKFNLFIVRLVTHQANTFPSGHAAAAVAVALGMGRVSNAIGIIYSVIAISIISGAFLGRYHYALDLLLGAALAVASYVLVSK